VSPPQCSWRLSIRTGRWSEVCGLRGRTRGSSRCTRSGNGPGGRVPISSGKSSSRGILQECGLEGRHLTLEITENAIISDTEQALKTLRGLKEIGVKVAIDDFGTGYSSFAQLKTLPVDELKIDYGFVRDLRHNNDDLAIVRSIIGLADSFGMHTVAEGVGTGVAAATLIALGCQHAKGFLYAKPVPAEDIEQLLTRPGTALRHPKRLGRPPS
jgi:EAL domain-containing protein (putative c-di-GMP-specific phosphodiesterase class I)